MQTIAVTGPEGSHAWLAGASPAYLLDTQVIATVAWGRAAVVTLFAAFDTAVSAQLTDTRLAVAGVAGLGRAGQITPVAAGPIQVVAVFVVNALLK